MKRSTIIVIVLLLVGAHALHAQSLRWVVVPPENILPGIAVLNIGFSITP